MLSGVSINCLTFLALECWLGNDNALPASVDSSPCSPGCNDGAIYEKVDVFYVLRSRSVLSRGSRGLQV